MHNIEIEAAADRQLSEAKPEKHIRAQTLNLTRPLSPGFVVMMLAFVALLLAIGEVILRTDMVQARLTAPSIGSRHWHLARQVHRLETMARKEGAPDCLFLGNSMVWRGIDVEAFQTAYEQTTGEPIRCFNFGVDALTAAGAGPLAQLLVEQYRPKLLIFGTDARDFSTPIDSEETQVILETPWLQYRLGNWSLDGWLHEYSYVYRYRRHIREIMRFFYRDALRREPDRGLDGFDSDDAVGAFVQEPPDPADSRQHIQYYYSRLSDYVIRSENLAALQQIVDQQTAGVRVLVVEMPVPETYMYFFGNDVADYEHFIDTMKVFLQDSQTPFWQTTPLGLIPDDGWVDYSHLNTAGARLFSSWLGHQVGTEVVFETR
jgi:hypothetical protein